MAGLGLDGGRTRDEAVVALGPLLISLLRLEFLQALLSLSDLLIECLLDTFALRFRGLCIGVPSSLRPRMDARSKRKPSMRYSMTQ